MDFPRQSVTLARMNHPSSALCSLAVLLAGCSADRSAAPGRQQTEERYLSDPSSVGFDIEPLPDENSTHRWLATYASGGKIAKFRIELGVSKPLDDKDSREFDVQSGKGRLVAEPGSDASVLLADLKKALEAKSLPAKVQRASDLPFTYVSFGKNQSQAPGGGFRPDPPGHWTPIKLFIGEGKQEGEVFLNLNPVIKKGQFSIKDEDSGDIALSQLARVL